MDLQQDREMSEANRDEPMLLLIGDPNSGAEPGEIDVVFVHGWLGSVNGTWTWENREKKEEFYWPLELWRDLNDKVCSARVWVLGYNAPVREMNLPKFVRRFLSRFLPKEILRGEQTDIQLSLKQRAEFLCQGLLEGDDRLGGRPIVFVAHRLGGLMVKAMLEREWISRGDKSRILMQTKAVVFLGTPHSGSSLANLAETLSQVITGVSQTIGTALANSLGAPIWFPGGAVGNKLAVWILGSSATMKSLKSDNPELFDLMKSYRSIAREQSIETLSCFETENYRSAAIVVSQSSADPGLGDTIAIMGANHVTISKPNSCDSPVYRVVRRVIVRAATKAQRATKRPVFDEQASKILRIMRASRFPMLPRFVWEMDKQEFDSVQSAHGIIYSRIENLPPNLTDNWDEKDGKNFRRRVVVEFFRQCEEQIRRGAVEISGAEEEAAQYSQFDIDKLVLIAWRKYRLEQALKDARDLIEEQCGYVRGTYEPTLTVLYQAIDSMDKALTDQLTLSLGTELRLVRDAIARWSQTGEKLDGDSITRSRINDLVAKIRTMAELSLPGESPSRRQ
jgi:hypothetical protein